MWQGMKLYAPQWTLTQSVRVFLLSSRCAGTFNVSATVCNASVHILSKRNNAPAQPSRFQHLHRRQVFAAATRNVKKWVNRISQLLHLSFQIPVLGYELANLMFANQHRMPLIDFVKF